MPQILIVAESPEETDSTVVYRERVAPSDLESAHTPASWSSGSAGQCPTPIGSNTPQIGSMLHRAETRRWPAPGCDQRDRNPKAGRAAQGGDSAAGLDGPADLAGAVAERGDGRLDLGGDESEAPEEGRPVCAASFLDRLLGRLHDLEDRGADAEEGLTRSAGRRRLLADAAQVEPGGLENRDRAVEVGVIATT